MASLNHYLRPRMRYTFWVWLASIILLTISGGLAFLAFNEHQHVSQLKARSDKLLAIQAASVPTIAGRSEQQEQRQWAQLKSERDFPWPQIFQAVEHVASSDIELLEFKPDKLNRRIELNGEARNLKALIVYLDALSKQPGWNNVHLVHQQAMGRGTLETISFEIKATLIQ